MPLFSIPRHRSATYPPTSGRLISQAGGGGSWNEASAFAQPTIRSKFWVIAATASKNGTTKTRSSAKVMIATASPRLFHSWRCTRSISGKVATTRVVAQMIAGKNGHRIQNEATISPATNRIASIVRTGSPWSAGPLGAATSAKTGPTLAAPGLSRSDGWPRPRRSPRCASQRTMG